MTHSAHRSRFSFSVLFAVVLLFLAVSPLCAKTEVDFDPHLNYGEFKTFAFIGGVKNLVMVPVDPDAMDDRVHHMVAAQLTKKGLREVPPTQNPDLVIRYWANPPQQVNVTNMGEWEPYSPYITAGWSPVYNEVSASSAKEGALIIDLISPKSKSLAWRLYLIRKIANNDKEWKKMDEELARAFESYPPSDADKQAKEKDRAAHVAKAQ